VADLLGRVQCLLSRRVLHRSPALLDSALLLPQGEPLQSFVGPILEGSRAESSRDQPLTATVKLATRPNHYRC